MYRVLAIIFVVWPLRASVADGKPARVIIIRHGEKPGQGNGLSVKGQERAAALVPFFSDGEYGKPAAIYAQGPSEKRPSRRPVETVTPLAQARRTEVRTYHHSDFTDMAKEIMSKSIASAVAVAANAGLVWWRGKAGAGQRMWARPCP